jgi:hypothetical protein
VEGTCDCGGELSGSIKYAEFPNYLRTLLHGVSEGFLSISFSSIPKLYCLYGI